MHTVALVHEVQLLLQAILKLKFNLLIKNYFNINLNIYKLNIYFNVVINPFNKN